MNPTAGKTYTIQNENSLSIVASRAYGDAQLWPRIWSANQTTLRSGNPDLIFPGEVIIIPLLPERARPVSSSANKDPDGIYIELDGYEVRPLECRILRTVDTIVNSCNFAIPWQLGFDTELDKRVRPKSYTPCKVSIGGELIINGLLYKVNSTVAGGTKLLLSIDTPTADLVDSTLKPPLERNNITLEARAKEIAEPLGFSVKVSTDTGGEFDRVTANGNQKIFDHLVRLARQRGVLLSNDLQNNVDIISANIDGAPIATLEEGVTAGVTGWGVNVDGREMFNVYRAVGRNPLGESKGKSVDSAVPRSRFKTVQADESTDGNIEAAATWARNKTTADALSFPLTVEGWCDPQGNLWKENEKVTIVSPSMFLEKGFDFLINKVEYILTTSGRSTVLSFVPPTVYSRGEIIEPW